MVVARRALFRAADRRPTPTGQLSLHSVEAMAEARIYPPSEPRFAEARRAGHVPRPSLVVLSCALVAVSGFLRGWAGDLVGRLGALWRELLSGVARGQHPDPAVVLLERVPALLGPFAWGLVAIFAAGVGFSFLAQGSARFVPFVRPRRGFERPSSPLTSKLLWVLLVSALALAALSSFTRLTPFTARSVAADWLARCAALSALVAVLDVVLARARFVRSLWLTRREHLEDQREAYGAPELRAARARLRQEQRARDASEGT